MVKEESSSPPPEKAESALKSFLSGGFGGICLVLVGHPLDLIKVRVQASTLPNASVLSMLRTTFRTEGVRGLYRGVSAPITAVAPIFAVNFWGYDMGKRFVKLFLEDKSRDLNVAEICVAGGLSAVPTTALMAPSERIKCLLQIQNDGGGGKKKYDGMADCAKQLYREGGIRSVYKGTVATLLRDVPGSVAYFAVYEIVKREIMRWQDTTSLSPGAVLTAGGLAGMATWSISIPADVLKSRFQTAPEGTYGGLMDVYTKLVKEEGYGGLFRGLRPALIRAFPANAACFFGMEMSRSLLTFLD